MFVRQQQETSYEYRTMQLRARGRIVGGEVDAAVLEAELNRVSHDGWNLVSAFGTAMDQGTSRYFVMVLARPVRRR